MDESVIWLLISLALGIIEIMAPGLVIIWFALSAFITGILAIYWPINIAMQTIIFLIVGTILLIALKPLAKNIQAAKQPVQEIVNTKTKIIDIIDKEENIYQLYVEGKYFRAKSNEQLNIGDIVIIEKFIGTTAQIRKEAK